MAMLACARIGAIHSVVFGGFAAPELATRIDDAKPKVDPLGVVRHRAGRVIAYKPLLDDAIELAQHKPAATADAAAAAARWRRSSPAAISIGTRRWRRRSRRIASRSRRPIRSTSSTPRARPASPRASCATMAATPSRSTGRWRISTAWSRARCSWPPPMSAGWSAIPTSSTGRCSMAARPCCIEGKPVGTPDAGAYWRLIAEHGVDAIFTAPTAFRAIRRDDPDGKLIRKYDLAQIPHAVPRRRARRSADHRMGRGASCKVR